MFLRLFSLSLVRQIANRGCVSFLLSRLPMLPGPFEQHRLGNLGNPVNKEIHADRQTREGIVALYAAPNPFLLNKICLNQRNTA